jgi:hypothetical protein
LVDEAALRKHAARAFEFHLVRRPQTEARVRLPGDQTVSQLSPLDLLAQYWRAKDMDPPEAETLRKLAQEVIDGASEDEKP